MGKTKILAVEISAGWMCPFRQGREARFACEGTGKPCPAGAVPPYCPLPDADAAREEADGPAPASREGAEAETEGEPGRAVGEKAAPQGA